MCREACGESWGAMACGAGAQAGPKMHSLDMANESNGATACCAPFDYNAKAALWKRAVALELYMSTAGRMN